MFGSYSRSAIERLRLKLPTALDEIVTLVADGKELLAPPDDGVSDLGTARVGYSLGTKEILSFPWVEVNEIDGAINRLSIGQVDADVRPLVLVRALYRHADVDTLDVSLKRYGWALLRCLGAPGAFGQGVTVSTVRSTWRTNPELDAQEQLVGVVVLQFDLEDTIDFLLA